MLLDAGINLVLGILLLVFNPTLVDSLGVPSSSSRFHPSILGAVFIGIALALMVEALRPAKAEMVGLGSVGAVCINLSGGLALAAWLLFGALTLYRGSRPIDGQRTGGQANGSGWEPGVCGVFLHLYRMSLY